MELNWSTFLLEVVNFLILVWILKHFFYLPVVGVIERRRKAIEESLAKAEQRRTEAEELERRFQARVVQWEAEKQQAREALQKEIQEERERRLAGLNADLEKEHTKAKVLEARRLREAQQKNQQDAVAYAAQFAAKLLGRIATSELEERLFHLLLEELPGLPDDCCESLRTVYGENRLPVRVTSAHALAAEKRVALQRALDELVGGELACEFVEDPALIAGLRVNIGPLVLRANLQDELSFFAEAAHDQS